MKNIEIIKLFKSHVFPKIDNQNWEVKRNILFINPVENILRGIYVESSAFSGSQFALNVFVQPLYIPMPLIILTFGYRHKTNDKKEWWDFDVNKKEQLAAQLLEAIKVAEINYLSKIFNASSFYDYYKKDKKISLAHFQAVAYSAAYAALPSADNELRELLKYISSKEDLRVPETKDLYSKIELLFKTIDRKVIFQEWEEQTRKAIKI
jgi:hypothetical protein